MANGNLPTTTDDLEINNWLKKLKENQDRQKEEKLRRYNDIVSKFIILLVAVCILSFIAIAALAIENNNLYKQNDQLVANYTAVINDKNDQISNLTAERNSLQNYVLSNRSFNNMAYTITMDPSLPKVSKIQFNNNKVHIEFVDGTPARDIYFLDYNLYVTNNTGNNSLMGIRS